MRTQATPAAEEETAVPIAEHSSNLAMWERSESKEYYAMLEVSTQRVSMINIHVALFVIIVVAALTLSTVLAFSPGWYTSQW